jgi:hypothetical protein
MTFHDLIDAARRSVRRSRSRRGPGHHDLDASVSDLRKAMDDKVATLGAIEVGADGVAFIEPYCGSYELRPSCEVPFPHFHCEDCGRVIAKPDTTCPQPWCRGEAF